MNTLLRLITFATKEKEPGVFDDEQIEQDLLASVSWQATL